MNASWARLVAACGILLVLRQMHHKSTYSQKHDFIAATFPQRLNLCFAASMAAGHELNVCGDDRSALITEVMQPYTNLKATF